MPDRILPRVGTDLPPVRKEKLLTIAVFGVGGVATFGWVALLGWGLIYLIGLATG